MERIKHHRRTTVDRFALTATIGAAQCASAHVSETDHAATRGRMAACLEPLNGARS